MIVLWQGKRFKRSAPQVRSINSYAGLIIGTRSLLGKLEVSDEYGIRQSFFLNQRGQSVTIPPSVSRGQKSEAGGVYVLRSVSTVFVAITRYTHRKLERYQHQTSKQPRQEGLTLGTWSFKPKKFSQNCGLSFGVELCWSIHWESYHLRRGGIYICFIDIAYGFFKYGMQGFQFCNRRQGSIVPFKCRVLHTKSLLRCSHVKVVTVKIDIRRQGSESAVDEYGKLNCQFELQEESSFSNFLQLLFKTLKVARASWRYNQGHLCFFFECSQAIVVECMRWGRNPNFLPKKEYQTGFVDSSLQNWICCINIWGGIFEGRVWRIFKCNHRPKSNTSSIFLRIT